jgi:hypothetical protein
MKYGLGERLNLSAEGFIADGDGGVKYPDRNFRYYHVGCGVLFRIHEISSLRIALAVSYGENLWFDTSRSQYHKQTKSVMAALQVERTFLIAEQIATLWGGPAYISDELIEYPWGSYQGVRLESYNDFGAVFGIDFLILDHIHIAPYLVYADYFQPRFAVGYRF